MFCRRGGLQSGQPRSKLYCVRQEKVWVSRGVLEVGGIIPFLIYIQKNLKKKNLKVPDQMLDGLREVQRHAVGIEVEAPPHHFIPLYVPLPRCHAVICCQRHRQILASSRSSAHIQKKENFCGGVYPFNNRQNRAEPAMLPYAVPCYAMPIRALQRPPTSRHV